MKVMLLFKVHYSILLSCHHVPKFCHHPTTCATSPTGPGVSMVVYKQQPLPMQPAIPTVTQQQPPTPPLGYMPLVYQQNMPQLARHKVIVTG